MNMRVPEGDVRDAVGKPNDRFGDTLSGLRAAPKAELGLSLYEPRFNPDGEAIALERGE